MKKVLFPQDQVFWYLKNIEPTVLTKDIKTQILIIGGGMAGLSAAQSFTEKGYEVTLIEKTFCGAAATGKSTGFITPDSELGLPHFVHKFGEEKARNVWNFVTSGAQLIRKNIEKYAIECDFKEEDVLVIANSKKGYKELSEEHEIYQKVGFESFLYDQSNINELIRAEQCYGGIRFPKTFGISCFLYCQSMKEILKKQHVSIYENTPAITITGNKVKTPQYTIEADYIIACVDRSLPELEVIKPYVFHAQTFILVSEELQEQIIQKIFPERRYMLWDTDMIYQYYRLIDDNRFIIGGSDMFSVFWGKEMHNRKPAFKKLKNYVAKKFPVLKDVNFVYMWPGLIGVSKDLIPIAGQDDTNPHLYYITCATGLPWAAALGWYSGERIAHGNNELDDFFSVKRKFPLGNAVQFLLGKRMTFALSNFMSLYEIT